MGVRRALQRAIIGISEQKENTVSKSYYIPEVTHPSESSELLWKLAFSLDFGREAIIIQHRSFVPMNICVEILVEKNYLFSPLSRRKESSFKRFSKPKRSLNLTHSELDRIQVSFLMLGKKDHDIS